MSLGITVALNTAIGKPVPLASARKRALVVDDSETILHAICTLLEHHDVVDVAGRAENGPRAIAEAIDREYERRLGLCQAWQQVRWLTEQREQAHQALTRMIFEEAVRR